MFTDILERLEDIEENYQGDYSAKKAIESLFDGNYTDSSGRTNTYYAYLRMLIKHHTMPVVISEFGVSTGRGMAQRDLNTNRNQGNMTEQEQGEALIECWEDIMNAGWQNRLVGRKSEYIGFVVEKKDNDFARRYKSFPGTRTGNHS